MTNFLTAQTILIMKLENKNMKLFTHSQLQELIDRGYEYYCIKEGALIDDLAIYIKDGYKSIVAKSVYLNEWSSAYSIRTYNVLPAKYQKMIDSI